MLSIYHWEPNANSGKPLVAVFEKGVPFESHFVNMLTFDQHKPEYLAVNPNGTIPAMVHDGALVRESCAMIDYIDMAFEGPALRPADPFELWRMRWWTRFFDQYVGPSASQIGWSTFVGPMLRKLDPQMMSEALEKIPLPERRAAWSKALYGTFTDEELSESRARLVAGTAAIERTLEGREWIAGDTCSAADLIGFMMLFGIPQMFADAANDQRTPNFMSWLRRTGNRSAVRQCMALASPHFQENFHRLLGEEAGNA